MKTGDILKDFQWQRAADGYQWAKTKRGLYLVARRDGAKPLRMISYKPFDGGNDTLFQEFADLNHTPESFLAFANRFGLLGYPVTMQDIPSMGFSRLPVFEAENTVLRGELHYRGRVGECYELDDPRLDNGSWSDHVTGMSLALEFASAKGDEAFSSQLFFNTALKECMSMFMTQRKTGVGFELQLKPVSLVGALWLQAAMAVSNPKTYRQCETCKRPLEIARGGGARADARFCSNACKQRDLRVRRSEARRLAGSGTKPSEIAKKLRSDVATVSGWLK